MTLFEAKQSAIKMLNQLNFQTPILDVNCLLQFLLNQDSTYILTHHQVELTQKQINDFFSLVEKRKTGLPIAYITSSKEFYSIDFYVTPDVLIPKPDTEILVEHAIEKIRTFSKDKISIVDVCTGSGCIGLSVLKNCLSCGAVEKKKAIDLTVTDLSLDALKVAKNNAQRIFKDEKNIFVCPNTFCFYEEDELGEIIKSIEKNKKTTENKPVFLDNRLVLWYFKRSIYPGQLHVPFNKRKKRQSKWNVLNTPAAVWSMLSAKHRKTSPKKISSTT